jgi:hypothetical protein
MHTFIVLSALHVDPVAGLWLADEHPPQNFFFDLVCL